MLTLAEEARKALPGLWAVGLVVERSGPPSSPLPPAPECVPRDVELGSLKDEPTASAYRRLSWRVGIDPTKHRPAGEALARRILAGKGLPTILPLVDGYNRASAMTLVPLGAYDLAHMEPPLTVRPAVAGETFHGIMRGPETLEPGRIVYADAAGAICGVFLWRDAQTTRVRADSERVLIMAVGGAPLGVDVGHDALRAAARFAALVGFTPRGAPVSAT